MTKFDDKISGEIPSYKNWHNWPVRHLFHWALLIVVISAAGLVIYSSSFQALVDQSNNPSPLNIYKPEPIAGEILVGFQTAATDKQRSEALNSVKGRVKAELKSLNIQLLTLPEQADDIATIAVLKHNPAVAFAEQNHRLKPSLVPNDPYYPTAGWHLMKINGPQAWDTTTGSSSVVIAILDSGVTGTVEDLAAKMVPGWNVYDNNADASDVYGHGTPVAGVAAAATNNAIGVAAVAWGSKIMPVRISDTAGYTTDYLIASGLNWAADHGAKVANISYQASNNAAIDAAANYFQSKGGVVTVSAGNTGSFSNSPDDPYVLTVGSTDPNDIIASYSTYGSFLDLMAPSSAWTTQRNGTYYTYGGTSVSAPMVAGVAALVESVNPSLTANQIQQVIKNSALDLGPSGWDSTYGWGRLDAAKAVSLAGGGQVPPADTTPPTASITTPANGATVAGLTTVAVAAADNVGVASVSLKVDGSVIGTTTTSPYTFSWDTSLTGNGAHTLVATATDAATNVGTSSSINVTVNNAADTTAPIVTITSPTPNQKVGKTMTISGTVSDQNGTTSGVITIDGAVIKNFTGNTTSFNFGYTTRKLTTGSHTLVAKFKDPAGNEGSANVVFVK